jgi:hypothetical protein
VSATTFTTGGGTSAETIAKSQVSYWSGPVTASSGLGVRIPGQATALNAVSLATPKTAFALQAVVLGTYTGTVAHSVA